MENRKVERDLMSLEDFKNYIAETSGLKTFDYVSQVKSFARSVRRGHALKNGVIMPKRPFSNRGNTSKRKGVHSRKNNELKKEIYGQFRQYKRTVEC